MRHKDIVQLTETGALPGRSDRAEVIETHISWVILTDRFAFKVNKPVKFTFVDFSTLSKRKHFCQEELELNRRLAPEVYLKVVPITRSMIGDPPGEGSDKVVDYAVQMKKLDRRKEMHRLLARKKVTSTDLDRLAIQMAAFHRQARIIKNAFDTTGFQDAFDDLINHMGTVVKHLGPEWEIRIRECSQRSNVFLNANRNLMNQRIITNKRRDGHGDFNATNIFLYQQPVVLDCIAFNRSLRQIDVLNEIAFLCVDLDFYGDPGLSEYFYHAYLREWEEKETAFVRRLFLYYKSYRANVLAKIAAIGIADGADQSRIHDLKKYLRLMENYSGAIAS